MNYLENREYFEGKKSFRKGRISGKNIGIAAAIILLLIILKPAIGILLAIIFGAVIYIKCFATLSDSEIDAIFDKEVQAAKEKALKKLGLDEDEVKIIEPILINGPCFENSPVNALIKKGQDGRFRSSNYESVVLFFSEKQVYSYTYRFSIIEANKYNESTEEYFYKDIVSVATLSEARTVNGESISVESFKLTTSGGTSIICSMWDFGLVEKSIQGMKQLLREKKNA